MTEAAQQQTKPDEEPFEPTAEMKAPHGAFVTIVYQNEIGGFCTPAKERLLADQHLKKTGILLRYSWEIDTEKEKRAKEWNKRLYEHLKANPTIPRQRLSMPKDKARRLLIKYERTYTFRDIRKSTAVEKRREDEDFYYMNQLRAILGLGPHDYRKEGVPQASQEAEQLFDELQQIPDPDARLAAVRAVKSIDVLRLLILGDAYPAIRELAERRYGELMVARR